jgi:hypothetical protein
MDQQRLVELLGAASPPPRHPPPRQLRLLTHGGLPDTDQARPAREARPRSGTRGRFRLLTSLRRPVAITALAVALLGGPTTGVGAETMDYDGYGGCMPQPDSGFADCYRISTVDTGGTATATSSYSQGGWVPCPSLLRLRYPDSCYPFEDEVQGP